jgi:signal transduction histidine kinase
MGVGATSTRRTSPSDRRPVVEVELLHESERTRVTRLVLPGGPVIRKEPLGADGPRRLRHELDLLNRLRGVAGIAQPLDAPWFPDSIVLADAGGTTLAELAMPLGVEELVGLAVRLARAVAGMHRRGVMHRDVAPANIVVSDDGAPCLVDFAAATTFAEVRPEFTHHTQIAGTLAYLAPEQTGRTGRAVDHRADLYALGAVLYELATGTPPFGTGDPLRLVHDHLARVPIPPTELRPGLPPLFSAIVMHLLEKEPDNRYQTADGLVHDLQRLHDVPAETAPRVGERDFPARLLAPSRLVGRETEVAALRGAFDDALAGRCRGVLISGASGVGKTALVNELRAVVTGRDGWFVAGKFDQYKRVLEFNAVHLVFRALGRLLLAEPEEKLARLRERIAGALGANAGLLVAAVPEFGALLGVPPDPGDPLTAQVRAQRVGVALLRAVASPKRPLVVFLDDLQWAGGTSIGFVDLVFSEEPVEGLLLVGASRDAEVDTAHPPAVPLAHRRRQPGSRWLTLANLPVSGLVGVVAEMLHVDPATAASLAELIHPRTSGNPYETVELLNALRRDGLLAMTAAGWRWDNTAVRAHLGGSDVAELLAGRVDTLPAPSRQVLEAMACLGGRAELSLLRTATASPAAALRQALAPALEESLLVAEPSAREAVRFRHDRIREAVLAGLEPPRRRTLQLAMARRLAEVPELFAAAAEQYLPVVDAVEDPAERARVVRLLRRAADQAALIGDCTLVDTLLSGALGLVDPSETTTLLAVHTGRHAALFSGGRLDEADEEYRTIERLRPTALQCADPTAVQVRSLTHRTRFAEAIELGTGSLRELGIVVPARDGLRAELDRRSDLLYWWLDHTDLADDLARPPIADPTLLAAAALIDALLPPTFFGQFFALRGWLGLEALRILVEHGPAPTLIGPAGHAAYYALVLRGDYAAGYRGRRRILALGEAHGYEPGTSHARFGLALLGCWVEPIENGVHDARRAREGLITGGDLANAGYTYYPAVTGLLDAAPSLDACVAEVEAGLDFLRRTGSAQTGQLLDGYRWLAGVLRGEGAASADVVEPDRYAGNPLALFHAHLTRALAAAVFGDLAGLARHTAAAVPLLPSALGVYPSALARLLRGLAIAGEVRAGHTEDGDGLLAELAEVTGWLAARATDAPANFLHLLRLLEAERAWALGDFRAAELGFDAARSEAASRPRPWHRALIDERAARFLLARGLDHAAFELLARARQQYLAWGATAKVDQLDWAYPTPRPFPDTTVGTDEPTDLPRGLAGVSTGTLDLLGILHASQALSAQTNIDQLHTRVVEVLGALTGATDVHLVPCRRDQHDWLPPTPAAAAGLLGGAGHEGELPQSVLRYVQRTVASLVVADTTRDDRFARDPYFADLDRCSLLAVPILSRGSPRALVLLENRLLSGAFSTDRLGAVTLIAGQLAVTLDNAQLYTELTASRARIVAAADQTRRRIERDLHDGTQQRLVSLALRLRAVQMSLPPDAGELAKSLGSLVNEATSTLDELGELARGIHPVVLAEGGLTAALETLARRSAIPVELDGEIEGRLPEQVETAAYYVVSEALTNAAKHAAASVVRIRVDTVEADGTGVLRVEVRDDGRGGAAVAQGTGLLGLKDRVEALGGRILLHSPPGAGTTLRLELPLAGGATLR